MSSKKMGRPKAEHPKSITLQARIDEKTYQKILEYCTRNHITVTEAIRQGIDLLLSKK